MHTTSEAARARSGRRAEPAAGCRGWCRRFAVLLAAGALVGGRARAADGEQAGHAPLLAGEAAPAIERAVGAPGDAAELEALVLDGAPVPPGLTASRRIEREASRAEHLAALAARLAGPSGRPYRHVLEGWLLRPDVDPERWAAAAAAVGELGLVALAPTLAPILDDPPTSRRRAVARRALHGLYGVWFEDAAAFEPFASLPAGATLDGYRTALIAQEERELELRRFAWSVEPARALEDLSDPDPGTRVAAAEALLDWLRRGGDGGLDPDGVADVVLARIAAEPDARALCAELELVDELLRDGAPDDPQVARVRELLERGLRGGPIAILPCAARSAAALPQEPAPGAVASADAVAPAGGGAADGGTEVAVEAIEAVDGATAGTAAALAAALERCAAAGPSGDPDATIAVLAALRRVTSLAGREALVDALGPDALVAPVLDLATDAAGTDAVRRAATAALADVAGPADLERVTSALAAPDGSLPTGALVVVVALAATLESGAPGLDRATRGALAALDDPSVDVRGRAVALLRLPAITPTIDESGRDALIARLAVEPVRELRLELLAAVRAVGGPRELERVLATVEFRGDSAFGDALATTIDALAAGAGELRALGARRVADAGSLRATALALGLMLSADEASAAGFVAADHAQVVRWGLALVDAGADLASSTRVEHAPRILLERHLPEGEGALDALEIARARAGFALADGREPDAVEVGLSVALGELAAHPERWRLVLDRARLRSQLGRPEGAAEDWRAALVGPEGGLAVERLSLADARAALTDLLAGAATPATGAEPAEDEPAEDGLAEDGGPAPVAIAVELGLDLLAREDWRLLTDDERAADLDLLVAAALASRKAADARRVGAHLDVALGTVSIEEAAATVGDAAALFGAFGEAGLRERAVALRSALAAAERGDDGDKAAGGDAAEGDSVENDSVEDGAVGDGAVGDGSVENGAVESGGLDGA